MTSPITPDPSIHSDSASNDGSSTSTPVSSQVIQTFASNLLEGIAGQIVNALTGGLIPANSPALAAIESFAGGLFDGSDWQTLLNNLWNGLTGNTNGTGKSVGDVLSALEAQFANILGIGSTASTALANAGTALTNAETAVANFASLLESTAQSDIDALGAWLTGTASNATTANANANSALTQLETLISSTVTTAGADINAVGAAISTAAANAASVINGIVSGLTGALGTAFTPAQATQALQGTAATTAANSAAVAALQTAVAGTTNGGLAVTVNFADYANAASLPAMFTTTYYLGGPVTLGITSGCAALQWPTSTMVPSAGYAIYNLATTSSDYQLVSGTFPTAPSNPYAAPTAINFLIGRANSTGTSYVFAALGYSTVSLGCMVGGTQTVFTSASYTFQAGATYSLVCGTTGGSRVFQVLCNGAVIPGMTWTDTSTSMLGAGYRYGGFGDYGYSTGGLNGTPGTIFGANIPGTMSQWNLLDNTTTSGVTQVSYGGTGAASLTGLVKGNGTAPFTAATPGVDYSVPGTGPRVTSMTSAAIPAFSTDTTDLLTITALTTAITSMTTGMVGTLHDGQKLMVRIHSASALAIAWGTSYQSSGVATLPVITVAGKAITVGLQYDAVTAKLVALAVDAVGY